MVPRLRSACSAHWRQLALILPNFTIAAPGPLYSPLQLAFVGLISLILYVIFVFVQTVRHRDYFVTGEQNAVDIPLTSRTVTLALVFLPLSLIAVVLMAKALSGPIDYSACDGRPAHGLSRRSDCLDCPIAGKQ